MENSIRLEIERGSTEKWGGELPKTQEELLGKSQYSVVGSVEGIMKTLGLDESIIEKLIGSKDEQGNFRYDGEIYTQEKISDEISSEIKDKIKGMDANTIILKILANVHDKWVMSNPDNFNNHKRDKDWQFVPLQLLEWEEVSKDLIYLKPILEAAGINVDVELLRKQHELEQKEYLIEKGIFSQKDLKGHLRSYSALSGLETIYGGNIIELLDNDTDVLENMTRQVDDRVQIRSREELAMEIIKADDPQFSRIYHVKTATRDIPSMGPEVDMYVTYKEILLSKLIGQPYPSYYFTGLVTSSFDRYENEYYPDDYSYASDATSAKITSLINGAQIRNEER